MLNIDGIHIINHSRPPGYSEVDISCRAKTVVYNEVAKQGNERGGLKSDESERQ